MKSNRRILWRSWAAHCADYELARISGVNNKWVSGHLHDVMLGDVWLTGNGCDFRETASVKATIYAEPYIYLKSEYNNFYRDNRWDVRFVYNPDYLRYRGTKLLPLAGYWRSDIRTFDVCKDKTFGMVLARKPGGLDQSDIGHLRADLVAALHDRDFIYWGYGWDKDDRNYQGETFVNRSYCDEKHFDAQELLARCRFTLALDNSVLNGYLTEKFWNAMIAGSVPVYFGHESVKDTVPPDLFVYGFDFSSVEDVIKFCERMTDSEWDRRTRNIKSFLESDDHSWDVLFRRIDEVFSAQE